MSRAALIVDDDRALARTLADILGLDGWDVSVCHSGEGAVEAIDERSFEFVIMDIKMDGMNGVEALKAIRERRPRTRVILMTAYSANELIEEARESGAAEVLSKPLAIPRVLELASAMEPDDCPVLVVDDDPRFLSTLCDSLESNGISTCRAEDLVDALRFLEAQGDIAVVLLDLKLKRYLEPDSIMAIREVSPDTLVFLFSGHEQRLDETVSRLPEGWLAGAFTKPLAVDEVLAVLKEHDAV